VAELPRAAAVKAGRLRSVDGDLLHRYGRGFVDGLEQLARTDPPGGVPMSPGRRLLLVLIVAVGGAALTAAGALFVGSAAISPSASWRR